MIANQGGDGGGEYRIIWVRLKLNNSEEFFFASLSCMFWYVPHHNSRHDLSQKGVANIFISELAQAYSQYPRRQLRQWTRPVASRACHYNAASIIWRLSCSQNCPSPPLQQHWLLNCGLSAACTVHTMRILGVAVGPTLFPTQAYSHWKPTASNHVLP